MPTLTTTIEDFSPVILYSGSGGIDWIAGNSSSDSSIDKYSDSSYMATQVANASVSFTFSGTGVQLYGAKRASHGSYQVTIDSHVYPPASGKANGTQEVFQTQLFQTVALQNGPHTVMIVNLGTTALDLDFITWQTPIGQGNEVLLSSTIQDSDSSFKYTPSSAWTTSPSNIGTFLGCSGHVTSTPGAFVEYTFKVSAAVAIYGPVGPQGASYSVQLDNGAITNFSSSKPLYRPQTMLFQAGNLHSGAHTVRLMSESWNNSASAFAIDYAQVFSTRQSTAALAAGDIVAIVLGILLAFILVAAGYFFYHYRRGISSDSGVVSPSGWDGYHPLLYSSQGKLQFQSSIPPFSMQSPTSVWPTGGATPVQSKTINPQVLNTNPLLISVSNVPDGKYRPDITRVDERSPSSYSEAPAPGTSSRPGVLQNSLLSSDFAQVSFMMERGGRQGVRVDSSGGVLPFVQLPGPAPPEYERQQRQ